MQALTQLPICIANVTLRQFQVMESFENSCCLRSYVASYQQRLELPVSTFWRSEKTLINVQHIVVTSEPYLSKQEFDSLRDRPAKSVVEKLFLLKIIRVINFCKFHCPRNVITSRLRYSRRLQRAFFNDKKNCN